MLDVAGGNRDKVGETQRWYPSDGTVDTSTRENRSQSTPREGRSWAVLDPDSDSLWTGWKVGLCEKPCAWAGSCFVRNSP